MQDAFSIESKENRCEVYLLQSYGAKKHTLGFPSSSVGKEYACNAGDPDSILESGRSTGEGTGYPLQYSWASLVAQLVKNLPTLWEVWVWSLGWEEPLEKGKATLHFYGLENSMDCIVHGVTKSRTRLSDFQFHFSKHTLLLTFQVRSS